MMLDHEAPVEPPAAVANAGGYSLTTHRSMDAWTWGSAVAIAAELRRDLSAHLRTRLVVSAEPTLVPVYKALSKAPLDWSRVDIALADERWLLPDDPDSHARYVRSHLLQHHAAAARFETLTHPGRRIEDAVAIANAHEAQPACLLVLAMGEDGHVASLFPGMMGLDQALASRQPYVAIDTGGLSTAAPWRRRIGLTPTGFTRIRSRMLLLRGNRARESFNAALASGNRQRWPVLAAIDDGKGHPLQVHWCA